MRKGFTLVELIAVVTILGIIAIVAIPSVDKALKDSKNNLYNIQVKNIQDGAKSWSVDNALLLPKNEGEVITLTLGQLKIGSYVEKDIKNPKTNELFPNDMEIVITRTKNNYKYELDIESGTEGNTDIEEGPTVILNGNSVVYVELGSTYEELGAIGRNTDGSDNNNIEITIRSNNTIVANVETDRLGQYKVTYSIVENGKTASAIRTVIVRDTTPPVLTIPGNISITSSEVSSFNVMSGVSATDNNGETVTIITSGSISTIEGTYTITYTAIDTKDNKTVKTRTITVVSTDVFNTSKGVNSPQVSTGMIPIKWNGNNWVTTTTNDNDWYDYSNKKWANVATIDKTKAIDYSNNAYYGMINGASQVSEGMRFDGVDDYIEADSRLKNYNFGNTVSFVARFKMNSINTTTTNCIIGNWENGGGGMYIDSAKYLYGEMYINGSYTRIKSAVTIAEGSFYTAVFTYDGATLKLYINGNLSNSTSITGSIGLSPVSIGVGTNLNAATQSSFSNAIMSHAMVYTRALTASEISSSYSSIPTLNTTNLLFGYDFTKTSVGENVVLSDYNMNTMWVWIPRYAYKITSGYHSSTTGTIDVKFLKGKTNNPVDGTKIEVSGYDVTTKNTSMHYFLHPAFNYDSQLGFWVAKFEPSGNANDINIVPNVESLRNMQLVNQFNASKDMRNNTKYGFNSVKVETMMMTNLQWGSVAYLTQSIYGKNSDVWINNSSTYITGCAATNKPTSYPDNVNVYAGCQNQYKTSNGTKASTTGNIYGIYDMSGGAWEHVMGNYNNLEVNAGINPSTLSEKYINIYTGSNYGYNGSVYGDAVYEVGVGAVHDGTNWNGSISGAWYTNQTHFPNTLAPWFRRGGCYLEGTNAGAFAYNSVNGNNSIDRTTFRPVLNVLG